MVNVNASLSIPANTYWSGKKDLTAGTINVDKSVLEEADSDQPLLVAGDTVLIIQMQGVTYDYYGNTLAVDENGITGRYEYARIASANEDGDLVLTTPLQYNYYYQKGRGDLPDKVDDTKTSQSRFQFVRVLSYPRVLVPSCADFHVPRWNGKTGGVLAIDAGWLEVYGTLDATSSGFRGGYAKDKSAEAGEGVVGTPGEVWNSETLDHENDGDGYRDYDDVLITGNGGMFQDKDRLVGGGGGANVANGGQGGTSVPNYPTTAAGGTAWPNFSTKQLIMGGGGGASWAQGSRRNSTVQSGQSGGGIILIRTARLSGNGIIRANGGDGPLVEACSYGAAASGLPSCPASTGGGGAGGSLAVFVRDTMETGILFEARGGTASAYSNFTRGASTPGTSLFFFSLSLSLTVLSHTSSLVFCCRSWRGRWWFGWSSLRLSRTPTGYQHHIPVSG